MIFFIFILVALFFVVLWNVDLHKTLYVKALSQNGGDAAALMGARWQGITLNLMGDLNIMQAMAIGAGDAETVGAISNLQARLALFGPMIGFMAAQQAAKNNGVHQNDDFTRMIREHAHTVRYEYPQPVGPDGEPMFLEPFDGAWPAYADMLDLAASEGIAAAPDNARYLTDYVGDHILLQPGFYDAVASRNWCWFHLNAPGLLEDYTGYQWWPALPEIVIREFINSELFGLDLVRRATSLDNAGATGPLQAAAAERGISSTLPPLAMVTSATWYCYGERWAAWTAMHTEEGGLPLAGPLRDAYDYAGADSAVRVIAAATRLTPGPRGQNITNHIVWTAAAKPFGAVDDETPPSAYPIVLPHFRDIRLIPMDASSAPEGGFDPEWRHFIEEDLPHYVETGQIACDSWYCNQLRTWEDAMFRSDGVIWLQEHSSECVAGGGGPGHGGGGRRGH